MPFEAFLTQHHIRPKKGRRVMVALSLVLHGGLVIAAVVYSFWNVDVLSPPTVTVTFLNNSPPSPPPPPPPKKKTAAQTKPVTPRELVQPKANEIVQPKAAKPVEEAKEDDGEEGGEEGGVAGGVVGGVAGGVAVAAPPAPARPPPPKAEEIAPKFLPPNIAGQQLLTDPRTDPRYRVALPPALGNAGMRLWAMLKVCVSEEGDVSDVKIIKSMDATADSLLQAKIKTWRYKPINIDGHAVRFCYNFRYEHLPQ
jgi:protein TonB